MKMQQQFLERMASLNKVTSNINASPIILQSAMNKNDILSLNESNRIILEAQNEHNQHDELLNECIASFPSNLHQNEIEKEQNEQQHHFDNPSMQIMDISDQQNNERPIHLDLIWQSNIE